MTRLEDKMRWLKDLLISMGALCYVFLAVTHAVNLADPLSVLVGVAIFIFLFFHTGPVVLKHTVGFLLGFSSSLRGLADFLQKTEVSVSESAPERSTLDILSSQRVLHRRALIAVTAVSLACMAVTVYAMRQASLIPQPVVVKQEKLRPPVADQPFAKKWQAPGQPEGIGGPADESASSLIDNYGGPSDDIGPPAPVQKQYNRAVSVGKQRKPSAARKTKDPWDFPRF